MTAADIVYSGAAGAVLVLAAARSRRITWVVTSIAAVWLAPVLALQAVAASALFASVHALATKRRRWVGAGVGAVAATVLARLGEGPFFTSTTILALLATAPILISALRRLRSRERRRLVRATSTAAALAVSASAVFGITAAIASGSVIQGIDAASSGVAATADGNRSEAESAFSEASGHFERSQGLLSGFWNLPARLVPVVSHHLRAAQIATSEGANLSATAALATQTVDVDSITLVQGAVDLSSLDQLAPVLSQAENALAQATERIDLAQSPWLVGPLNQRLDELASELEAALPAASTAAIAIRELPAMLGGDGPVQWLVLTVTPAEARGLGGLVGNYLVVEASGGQLSIVGAGRNTDLNRLLTDSDPQLRASTQYVERWGASSPEVFFQDVGLSPDLPTVGAVAADLYEQATGLSIEGVVTLDPYAMQALLTLTGPVSAGGLRLDASNVVPYILVDQYNEFEGDEAGREAALGALVTAAFDALTGTSLPGPRALADALGPVVEQDRLGVWWKAGGPVAELTALTGLDNAFPLANGDDLIGLVHQNAGQNKIDVYLQRRWTYTAEVDDGSVSATLLAEFINDAPGTGLSAAVIGSNDQGFDFGTNVALVHVHTALDLVEARIDGQVVVPTRQAAFDGEAIGVTLEIPPGASVTLEVSLQGQVNGDYQLHLVQQPLVNPDTVSVDVTTDGEQSIFVVDEVLEQDLVLENGG